ncbi:UNVERIFIED_CONTAM: hypothetical protein Sangu_1480000 [Sesamum angustifolium]|uniref:RING-CH-type domain-containing protein n=1 Tax=Sesamum angustifolium TaxID=2727405 RepID=A0AAW2MR06_9LAMI
MATLEMPHVDLECGRRSSAGVGSPTSEEDEEEGSHWGSSEILEDEAFESRRASSAADLSDCSVDIESGGVGEKKVYLGGFERDCRICHLSLVSSSPGSGVAIELGCSCKDDLAAAHKHCAETWFKIKGNK